MHTGCTPDVHRMYTGCTLVELVYIRCTSGVHPVCIRCAQRVDGSKLAGFRLWGGFPRGRWAGAVLLQVRRHWGGGSGSAFSDATYDVDRLLSRIYAVEGAPLPDPGPTGVGRVNPPHLSQARHHPVSWFQRAVASPSPHEMGRGLGRGVRSIAYLRLRHCLWHSSPRLDGGWSGWPHGSSCTRRLRKSKDLPSAWRPM
jgi:hypothetical protein